MARMTLTIETLRGGMAWAMAALFVGLLPACAPFPLARPAHTIIPGGRVTLPFEIFGLRYVRTRVDEKGPPQLLLIDTGAWCLTLSPEAAAQLKARERPTIPYPSVDIAGTWKWQWTTHHVDEMRIGDVRIQEIDAEVRPVRMYSGAPQMAGGILGIDVFRDGLLTLDFPAEELVIEQGELPPPDGQTILPFRQVFDDVEVQVTLAGQPMWVKIDSGAYNDLVISDDIAKDLSFKEPLTAGDKFSGLFGKEAPSRQGTLNGSLKLGQYEIPYPVAQIGGRSRRVLIGMRLLEAFRVTIDQKNQRIRFQRP